MRINHLLLIVAVTTFAGGSLLSLACIQSSTQSSFVYLFFSLGVSIGGSGYGLFKFRQTLASLREQLENCAGQKFVNSGITELDGLGSAVFAAVQNAKADSIAEIQELREVKQLVADIDRRAEAFDRDGRPVTCAEQLRAILKGFGGEIDSSIRQAVSCGDEIRRATEEIVAGSEIQSDAVDQSTSFVEQLSQEIISVCDHAESALQASSQTRDCVNDELSRFQNLTDQMKQMRAQAATRERKLKSLGQHTKEIESIAQTVGLLSSRTDLLALNASIESVRAGEHGRGFAVVAEEVRMLAEQSAQAVQDINSRIELIQMETHQSIAVASDEHEKLQSVIQQVSSTLAALQNICHSADDSAQRLNAISKSSTQQLRLARDVVDSLERGDSACKKNRSRAEGVHWTSKTLAQLETQLDTTMEFFRLTGSWIPQVPPQQIGDLTLHCQPKM